jgi:hypothetical protein
MSAATLDERRLFSSRSTAQSFILVKKPTSWIPRRVSVRIIWHKVRPYTLRNYVTAIEEGADTGALKYDVVIQINPVSSRTIATATYGSFLTGVLIISNESTPNRVIDLRLGCRGSVHQPCLCNSNSQEPIYVGPTPAARFSCPSKI